MKLLLVCLFLFTASLHAGTFVMFSNFETIPWFSEKPDRKNAVKDYRLGITIQKSLAKLKEFSLSEFEACFGPEGEIPESYLLPSYNGLTVRRPNSQVDGVAQFVFYPLGEDSGLVVLRFDGEESIAGARIYFSKATLDNGLARDPERVRSILEEIHEKILRTGEFADDYLPVRAALEAE